MPRIEIELTSSSDDGTWTWRAAGARLPRGAVVINAARGGHVVDEDLLKALDDGHLAAATLDVFHTEPLPDDHPFWDHPKVTVTPHVASLTVPATAAEALKLMSNHDPNRSSA